MKILLIDNYDSFTYNLVSSVRTVSPESQLDVIRNDRFDLNSVLDYDAVILSPGPGIPKEAGLMPAFLKQFSDKIPILGVCLGHQAIGECFGASLQNLEQVMHGVATPVTITKAGESLFQTMETSIDVGRYHSWVIDPATLPDSLEVLAYDEAGQIMAIKHRVYPVFGVQFHPESILTPEGDQMIRNFFDLVASESLIA